MKMQYSLFPQDIIDQYKLADMVAHQNKKGDVWFERNGGSGIRPYTIFLNTYGYKHVPGTAGLWTHDIRMTAFCLCVDDIALKYHTKDDLDHFLSALGNHYKLHMDLEGRNYMGLTMDWHYDEGYVDVSMPGYIPKLLKRLQHPTPSKPQYSPHDHYPIKFPKKGEQQLTPIPDTSDSLSPKEITHIQSIVGALLYYGRALDNTILPALDDIAMFQSKPTEKNQSKIQSSFRLCCNISIRHPPLSY
jgi:hypothetical protein